MLYLENKEYSLEELIQGVGVVLVNNYATVVKNKASFKFCGFLTCGQKLYAVMPKMYQKPADGEHVRLDMKNLFNVLLRYKKESPRVDEYEEYLLGNLGSVDIHFNQSKMATN